MRLATRIGSSLAKAWRRADRPVPALPIDLFRIGAGALCVAYLVHLRRDVPRYSSQDGVVDHRMVRRMLPFTRLTLFHGGMSDRAFRGVYTVAIGSSVGLMLGVKPRLNAAVVYVTAVSSYRWNFLHLYVDDVVMHLVLFWLTLLPTGTTLAVGKTGDWRRAAVPGFVPRLFAANLALIYLVAGLWKWTSPLWRSGLATYATLKMPISRAPLAWTPSALRVVRPASHAAMLVEPALAAIPLLRPHSRPKLALGGALVAFHAGILGALKIPFANTACIAGLPLFFRDEVHDWLAPGTPLAPPTPAATSLPKKLIASVALGLLVLQNVWRVRERNPPRTPGQLPSTPTHHRNPWTAPLYVMGLAQSYRLLDWVDDRNWHQVYDGTEATPDGPRPFDTTRLFPHTMRSVLLHSYIVDQCWRAMPRADLAELQRSLLTRHVALFAREFPDTGPITIHLTMSRICDDNLDLRVAERRKVLEFRVTGGVPTISYLLVLSAEG